MQLNVTENFALIVAQFQLKGHFRVTFGIFSQEKIDKADGMEFSSIIEQCVLLVQTRFH